MSAETTDAEHQASHAAIPPARSWPVLLVTGFWQVLRVDGSMLRDHPRFAGGAIARARRPGNPSRGGTRARKGASHDPQADLDRFAL